MVVVKYGLGWHWAVAAPALPVKAGRQEHPPGGVGRQVAGTEEENVSPYPPPQTSSHMFNLFGGNNKFPLSLFLGILSSMLGSL